MTTSNSILPEDHILSSNYSYRIERVLGVGGFGLTDLASAMTSNSNKTKVSSHNKLKLDI